MVHRLICFFALARGIIIFYVLPLLMLCFLQPIFVRSLLMHFHSKLVSDAPLARDSVCVCIRLWGRGCRWLDHSSIRGMDGLAISSAVPCMKLLLDFIRFFGTVWPCCGGLLSFTLIFLSLCAATPLLIARRGIPASRHKLSILLGCRHPVMEWHAAVNTGFTLCSCADLSHTGHAYSTVE